MPVNSFFLEKNYKIFNADCRKAMAQIPENSIDLIVTDPPYFIDKIKNLG